MSETKNFSLTPFFFAIGILVGIALGSILTYDKTEREINTIKNYTNCLMLVDETKLNIAQLSLKDVSCYSVQKFIMNNRDTYERWILLSRVFKFDDIRNKIQSTNIVDSTNIIVEE